MQVSAEADLRFYFFHLAADTRDFGKAFLMYLFRRQLRGRVRTRKKGVIFRTVWQLPNSRLG